MMLNANIHVTFFSQPMLCVSAINPFLFSKVPALLHVMGIRKNIGAMFPYIRCPFRISIQRGFRSRCHLLESNDFFALRDLVDLSKGAFAGTLLFAFVQYLIYYAYIWKAIYEGIFAAGGTLYNIYQYRRMASGGLICEIINHLARAFACNSHS